jgi:hypothetical protein
MAQPHNGQQTTYRCYTEYRDSGVEWLGKIPAHWEAKRLKTLCAIFNGATVENRRLAFNQFFEDILHDMFESNADIYKKIVDDPHSGELFRRVMFEKMQRQWAGDLPDQAIP